MSGLALLGLLLLVAVYQLMSFGRAAASTYDVELPQIVVTTDSATVERGRHLAESLGGCLGCHGPDLGGALVEDVGPIGLIHAPNITTGGAGADYSDGELARAIRHGIDSDGRSLLYMPTLEYNWWPAADLIAVVSFVRSMPPVQSVNDAAMVRPLGKVLNQFGVMQLLSAETVDHDAPPEAVPAPEPTARYGEFIARGCIGCHGENLSGGRIPGAPSSLAIPANLTPHDTGLGPWTKADFAATLKTGVRPDGRRLDSFMPIKSTRAMNEIEMDALWAYLRSVESLEFGSR
jgi:mono/diheme cytochrome c family protein